MRKSVKCVPLLLSCLCFATVAGQNSPKDIPSQAGAKVKGLAVIYPIAMENGTETAKKTAFDTVGEIAAKNGYSVASKDVAQKAWAELNTKEPSAFRVPSEESLRDFAGKMGADIVIYGRIKWHTRSVWVGLGPKTLSTATTDMYVYDVSQGKTVYKRLDATGRSDEKENMYKIAADILVTPIVTAVSGGPGTPREQRAVQIALARALHDWIIPPAH